ncbi:hypothetical protein LEP1GSC049_0742 [Leptospira kirschneri serovar Cynopteri str. 3522 CT]|nr:hypothetical protein LEP1GSC044_1326 [Leptospira kirschneri serovar Grippotyphosa str. RM52]EKP04835.1 hypothetical protein LEP1GSC018_3642 [Leptospira kirschneri str. 2008720114]EKQ83716.1 hypothetical protein LEP1GSC064_1003 [Leptospira kirschneri serovar Grippotyphosa str. Moskva]EMJ90994.1 hypothetical protein LEP1GSC198_1399 [Leptospira kirschneri str. JB]EMK08004.1 hypothetical protein LEP1GSC176_2670 [Leptospira kirschneri str. MMD1493]EMK18616.1 hypothetical protein LEP1GSC042_1144 
MDTGTGISLVSDFLSENIGFIFPNVMNINTMKVFFKVAPTEPPTITKQRLYVVSS